MKRLLLMGLVVGVAATAANATTLRINWAGTTDQKIFLAPSDTAVIEVWVDLDANDVLGTVGFTNEGVVNLVQQSHAATPDGWFAAGADAPFDDAAQQFGVSTDTSFLAGPGSFLVGTQTIHLTDAEPFGSEKEVVIAGPGAGGAPPFVSLISDTGAIWSYVGPAYAGYAGSYSIGRGASGAPSAYGTAPRDPLLVTKIPEPASLALLALGGLALVRRRR